MYSLKSSLLRRLTAAEIQTAGLPEGRIFQLLLTFVVAKSADANQDITVSTFIDTETDAINAIIQNLARLNDQEVLLAKVAGGTFTIVVPEPVVVVPTAEELVKVELEAKRAELREAKADVEIGLLTEAEFIAKVAEVKAPVVTLK